MGYEIRKTDGTDDDLEIRNILKAFKSPETQKAMEVSSRINKLLENLEKTTLEDMSLRAKNLGLTEREARLFSSQIFHEMREELRDLTNLSDPVVEEKRLERIKAEILEAYVKYWDEYEQASVLTLEDLEKRAELMSQIANLRTVAKDRISAYTKVDILEIIESKLKGTLDPKGTEAIFLRAMGASRGYQGAYHLVSERIHVPLWSNISIEEIRGIVAHEFTHAGFNKKGPDGNLLAALSVERALRLEDGTTGPDRSKEIKGMMDIIRMYDESFAYKVQYLNDPNSSDKVPFSSYGVDEHAFKATYSMLDSLLSSKSPEQIDRIIARFSRFVIDEAYRIITENLSPADFVSSAMNKLFEVVGDEV